MSNDKEKKIFFSPKIYGFRWLQFTASKVYIYRWKHTVTKLFKVKIVQENYL
jgi:hypothetical protein